MFSRRRFLVQTGSTLAVTLGAAQLAQAASVAGWLQQQGGSQDMQTGLVWLDWTTANGSLWSHTGARNEAAACTSGGYSDWRLPTRAEMTAAVTNKISLNCPLGGTPDASYLWWSSTLGTTQGGKGAYAMDLRSGIGRVVLFKSSYLYTIFVRQGTL